MTTIYALTYHLLNIDLIDGSDIDATSFFDKVIEHYYWFVLGTIPCLTLATMITFRDKEYNFWEYFILETFKVAQRLFVHILFLPVIYLIDNLETARKILYLLMILDTGLIIWTNLQFFNKTQKLKVVLQSVISYLLYIFQIVILLTVFILLTSI